MDTILITGGTGLIGSHLTEMLLKKGYSVSHLSRSSKSSFDEVKTYVWDPSAGTIDDEAVLSADAIIHLAGAGLAEKRWTPARKKELIESRVQGAELIHKSLEKNHKRLKVFISASGVGVYGNSGDIVLTETAAPGDDFVGELAKAWEDAAEQFQQVSKRVVIFRTGIVLSKEGGALAEFLKTGKWGLGAALGGGEQYYSWIHISDICRMYLFALEDRSADGVFNAVSPNPVKQKVFMKQMLKALGKPQILMPAPAFALRIVLGEMATAVLDSQRATSAKIQRKGFQFLFPELPAAFDDLLK